LALSVKKDNLAIIDFDSSAYVLKAMNERIHPEAIIELILNIESGGKTNLEEALSLAQQQLMQSSSKDKIVYLISDLERTTGRNPLPIINKLPNLRVIYAKTYRRVSFVDDVISLPNVSMEELDRDSDLVELTTRLIS
jgi:Mg-chelatase subunit ChlD